MKKEEVYIFDRDDIILLLLQSQNLLNNNLENISVVFTTDELGSFGGIKVTVVKELESKKEVP